MTGATLHRQNLKKTPLLLAPAVLWVLNHDPANVTPKVAGGLAGRLIINTV
jgi:hypothetical protein